MNSYTVHTLQGFRFIDEGPRGGRPAVVLLHGMLGGLENWTTTIAALADNGFRVVAPVLPVYDLPRADTSVSGLKRYTTAFLDALELHKPVLVGNSLGGHVALLYALEETEQPTALVLTGASGVHEVVMGETVPRRFDREFVRDRAAFTFFDPRHVSEELVDGVMEIVADRKRVLKLIQMARASRNENVEHALASIKTPTLLIWGEQDRLTPPDVARRFQNQLANAQLRWIPECGHAPMIEHPRQFNALVIEFLTAVLASRNGSVHRVFGTAL